MIYLNYKLSSFSDFLHQLAGLLHTSVVGDKLMVPAEKGTGYFKVVLLGNGLEAMCYDISLNETIVLKRERDTKEYYTLAFDQTEKASDFNIVIGNDQLTKEIERGSAFYLTSFLYDTEYILNKGVHLRGVRVLLTTDWMRKYLKLSENENVLEKYINMKSAGVMFKPIGEETRQLFEEIMSKEDIPSLFRQNRMLQLVERFFEWLWNEGQEITTRHSINRYDIEMAQKVEAILTNDITKLPPTIKQLAKEVAMSESKLKKIFKAVYGLPPYEYYQQQRMQRANLMLTTGQYSIKDVGYTLGYSNLSNFTLAFKKVFGKLPSEVMRSVAK